MKKFTNQLTNALEAILTTKDFSSLPVLGKGEFGVVYEHINYAIKVHKDPTSDFMDPLVLERMNTAGIPSPRLHAYSEGEFMVVDRLHGETMLEKGYQTMESMQYLPRHQQEYLLYQVEKCIENGILPYDITPDNVLIEERTDMPIIIDVGAFRFCNEKFIPHMREKFLREFQAVHPALKAAVV